MIVRKATHNDVPAIAKVHVDTWRIAYQGIVPDDYLANLSYEQSADGWYQLFSPDLEGGYFTYVAEQENGEIVGFATGGRERTGNPTYKGELTTIYILQNHQGKGIGRCLVGAVVESLHLLGMKSMLIWVLMDNPACQFYAALGGKRVYEKEVEIGGKPLTEVAYGWIDTMSIRFS
ncbi:MAG: GNAT family N-acetyltransferase [Pseudanabaenaceae cyanobacterium bins.39]|nr:GNAT family N-acetyltransferase [Pseudanabaenaceae cyanobacterium bins.39]